MGNIRWQIAHKTAYSSADRTCSPSGIDRNAERRDKSHPPPKTESSNPPAKPFFKTLRREGCEPYLGGRYIFISQREAYFHVRGMPKDDYARGR